MTALMPHALYAKDQSYAKPILAYHVLRSGATAGALLSIPTAVASTLYFGPRTLPTFSVHLLTHSFRGTLAGLAFGFLALESRMWGKDHVEWQDRTWRLLGNKGQVEVDNWILGGEAVGGVAALVAARRGLVPPALKEKMGVTIIGAMGLGAAIGTGEYMVWRYGIKRERFSNEKGGTPTPELVMAVAK